MRIDENSRDGFVILRPVGRIDGAGASEFQARLIDAAAPEPLSDPPRPVSAVILDLSGVTALSPAALRALLSALRRAKAVGGRILLAAVPDPVRADLDASGFSALFETHGDVEGALASLTGGPPLLTRN